MRRLRGACGFARTSGYHSMKPMPTATRPLPMIAPMPSIPADEELRERLAIAISNLPDRLQLIVQLYFLEELNLSEIAETIQVSVPRVHQLKAQAIERLRTALAGLGDII